MGVRRLGVPGGTAAVFALLCLSLSGCGSGNDAISEPNATSLHEQVDAVRAAASAGDNAKARARLAELRTSIRQLSAAGALNPDDGMVLLGQVDQLAERIEARATPTPTPTPAPVAVRVPVVSQEQPKDAGARKDAKGHPKAKGHKK